MSSLRVLIIGGGVGGLALAHGLKNHKIPFHVYEKDRTQDYRAQGYRVRLSPQALTALDYLLDEQTKADFEMSCAEFRSAPIPEIDAVEARVDEPNQDGQPPSLATPSQLGLRTVDRPAFREVLINNLGADNISYDKDFKRYEQTSSGAVAQFANGSSAEGTLLVGADGSYSRVRKQLLPMVEVVDTGARCIYGKTPLSQELIATLEPVTMRGMSIIKDRSNEDVLAMVLEPIIFPHRAQMEAGGFSCPADYLFWVLTAVPGALGFKDGDSPHLSLDESEKRALQISAKWHPSLRPIMEQQQKGETSAFAITSVKSDFGSWDPNPHVTAIGDAVHKMAPIGTGAFLALTDAQALCRVLAEEGQSKDSIGKYEDSMRQAASKNIKMSWMAVDSMKMKRGQEKHLGELAMGIRKKRVEA